MIRLLLLPLLLPVALLAAFPAAADTVKVLTTGPFRQIVTDMQADFEQQTGNKVVIVSDIPGGLVQRVRTGEAFDVIILPTTNLEQLTADGRVLDESVTPFGKVGLGMAVSLSAAQPNISNAESLRRTLLDARTVAFADPAAGGAAVARLFQQLGIGSQMQSRSVIVRGGQPAERVARGEAEIALQSASELRMVPSVRFAGMLPPAVQTYTVYAGALSPAARSKDAALTLMSVLSDPGIEPILRRRGLETP